MNPTLAAFAEPADSTLAALRTYAQLFAGQRARLAAAAIVYLIKHSPAVLLPVITGITVDLLAEHAPLTTLLACAAGTALLIAQNLPGHRLYIHLISHAVRDAEAALRSALAERLLVLSLPWWWRQSPAALQTKLLRDVESVGLLTMALADGVLGCGSGIAVALAVTAWRAPQFLWLFLCTVPLAAALVWFTRKRLGQAQNQHREAIETLGNSAAEMARLLPLTRAHGLEPAQLERVGGHISEAARTGLALDQAGGRFGAMAWVGFQGMNALCLFVAAGIYASGWIALTLGDVVLLSGFFATLTNSVLGLANLVPQIHRGIEAIRSLDLLLRSAPVQAVGTERPARSHGQVSFEAATLAHEVGAAGAGVHAITLTLAPGETVALVGPSGSGKTTLAMLACGLLEPQAGRVLIDGVALATLDPQAWRRQVAWVPQDALLGDGTVRDNLAFGLGPVDDAALWPVLHETGCKAFVERLPQGLDTPLGHHGHRLSGGERQRLALARALLREPRLLVLDEPTSALDGQSERIVMAALERSRATRATLVIAHRLSTVANADRLVVMDAGHIVDQGRHDELLARCGLYRRLWQDEESAP
ncbi:ABC transporter ATP-binding protein [Ideonella sp.]|uniref:ABC transporter ATP-binding protein n=1 Tax=Ideonella sp. TaxID=1929293 RepID=UPI002B46D628|nr:ABC transporter ATP-binding protein [Ideonella sp.]HJV69896.1 ABC transporter ATP-binding protein [Ideonella sp.]